MLCTSSAITKQIVMYGGEALLNKLLSVYLFLFSLNEDY